MKNKIYQNLPVFLQELMIAAYNWKAYKVRYGKKYQLYRTLFAKNQTLTRTQLENLQQERWLQFIRFAKENSPYYKDLEIISLENIQEIPVLKKETLRQHTATFFTLTKKQGVVSKTGGTTGKSLEILFTPENMQERFAMLDHFRAQFGYSLGKKTAWFSGKTLLTQSDIKKNRFWKTDHFHKVRYYSTFHIKEDYLRYYVENLIDYCPEYMVGFPSTILEIAKYGLRNGYTFPPNTLKAVFPTAETLTQEMYDVIEQFFQTQMYNQYASSEGAPFIFECKARNLHLDLQSGVFEVINDQQQPDFMGKLLVTSFTTEGTPLIRYDIGDALILDNPENYCSCGNQNPLVKEILGREDDYVYSPENGKINLGNVSNTLKDTSGIIKFQVVQNHLDAIEIRLQTDANIFNEEIEKIFIKNWRERVGNHMKIKLIQTDDFSTEKSGKFRMVKNNIKHLL